MTSTDEPALTWALVPLKSPERAKSRLAAALSPEQRLRLFFVLAERVIRTLHATRGIDHVAVITANTDIALFASSLGATPILQSADFGMSAAFAAAISQLPAAAVKRVLMLPGDLPLISSTALEALLAAGTEPVVVVPDRHRVGTNALLCCPPDIIAPNFGGRSFERHVAAAKAAGIDAQVLDIPALALDLDHPEDLDYLRCCDAALATRLLDDMFNDRGANDEYPRCDTRPTIAAVNR
jgi:2-phospho-L-lactate guanylyltransferase